MLFIALVAFLFDCNKEKNYSDISILGHGATGLEIQNAVYHDNTTEGVEFTLSMQGCQGVEIDVQLSKDTTLWLYHNEVLGGETTGKGCVADLTDKELQEFNYKTLKKEKLAKLSDLKMTYLKNKILMLDIRHFNHCKGIVLDPNTFIDAIKKMPFVTNEDVTVYCLLSNPDWIPLFRANGLSVLYSVNQYEEASIVFSPLYDCEGIVVKNKGITDKEVAIMRSKSKKVYIFDVRAPKETRGAMKKHPEGIITDDVRTALIEKY